MKYLLCALFFVTPLAFSQNNSSIYKSNNLYAQNSNYVIKNPNTPIICQNKPIYHLNISEELIKYNLDLYSYQLPSSSYSKSNNYVLGSFQQKWSIERNVQLNRLTYKGSTCEYFTDVYLNIKFHPAIYISKEAQNFPCTYQRVVDHEYKHYTNSHNAFVILSQNVETIVRKYLDRAPVSINNSLNITNYLAGQTNLISIELQNLIRNNTLSHDLALDQPENYQRESLLCGIPERDQLLNILRQYSGRR